MVRQGVQEIRDVDLGLDNSIKTLRSYDFLSANKKDAQCQTFKGRLKALWWDIVRSSAICGVREAE